MNKYMYLSYVFWCYIILNKGLLVERGYYFIEELKFYVFCCKR